MEDAGGVDLADVSVHGDSPLPARHDADALAVGGEIHLGPRGADLLAHELWHAVQQRQGRVVATGSSGGVAINDAFALEAEAEAAARGRWPAAAPAGGAEATAPVPEVAQFGRGKKKDKGKEKVTQPAPVAQVVNVEDTTSRDIAADYLGDERNADLKSLMQEAALAALQTYAFHATRSSSAASILASGLDPDYGGSGAAADDPTFKEHSKDRVHYARKFGLAVDYQRYFEGQTPFGPSKQVAVAEPAEILQVVTSAKLRATEQVDPDSKAYDRAFTNTRAIPPEAVRPLKPQRVDPSDEATVLPRLKPRHVRAMLAYGAAESDALYSNMTRRGQRMVDKMVRSSERLTREDVLHMLRQGLHSFRLEDLVDFESLLELGLGNLATVTPTGQDPPRYKDRVVRGADVGSDLI